MMPDGLDTAMFNNIDPHGNPTDPITNQLVNFGWEYVWHCHILSHEEMDMMRPQTLALPPVKPTGSPSRSARATLLAFNDNSINETSFRAAQRRRHTWVDPGTVPAPLDQPNIHEVRTFTDPATYNPKTVYQYQVVAKNTAGYGAIPADDGPVRLRPHSTARRRPRRSAYRPGPVVATIDLSWTDNATDETGFTIQRSDNAASPGVLASLPANTAINPAVTGMVT